jgi:hypothetical protein
MTDLALSAAAAETWPLGPEQRAAAEHPDNALLLTIDITGRLNEARLRAALLRVAGRHEILRTAFVAVPGYRGLRAQPLDAPAAPGWAVLDLRGRADAAAALAQDLQAQRAAGFDLAVGAVPARRCRVAPGAAGLAAGGGPWRARPAVPGVARRLRRRGRPGE